MAVITGNVIEIISAQEGEEDPETVPVIKENEVKKLSEGHYSSYSFFDLEDAVAEATEIAPGYSMVVIMNKRNGRTMYRLWFSTSGKIDEQIEDP